MIDLLGSITRLAIHVVPYRRVVGKDERALVIGDVLPKLTVIYEWANPGGQEERLPSDDFIH